MGEVNFVICGGAAAAAQNADKTRGHCGNMSEHVSDLALLIYEEQAIDYCRYYDNHHLEVVKGFFLNSVYKVWGMPYHHQASARFQLDFITLVDRRHGQADLDLEAGPAKLSTTCVWNCRRWVLFMPDEAPTSKKAVVDSALKVMRER